MKIVYEGGSAEIVEKKSRFIADVAPVKSEEEAASFIESVKKKYWDCKHNCSAFVIGESPMITRCRDDGEPAGTAGRPILDMLLNEGITNVCIVVSRYFGGTLLGTGGLVRAYGKSTSEGLKACKIAEQFIGNELTVEIPYDLVGAINKLVNSEEHLLYEISSSFGQNVSYSFLSTDAELAVKKITDLSAGKANCFVGDKVSFIVIDGKVIPY